MCLRILLYPYAALLGSGFHGLQIFADISANDRVAARNILRNFSYIYIVLPLQLQCLVP